MNLAYSIIIVNFNGGLKLLECFDSLFEHTSNFEAILVDNASTDNSVAAIAEKFPQTIIVKNSENLGVATANNVGIRRSGGRWIVLLNPDTKVTENWIDNLVVCGGSSNEVGIITPKLLYMDRSTINSTGHLFNFKMGFARDRGSGQIDRGQYDSPEEVASCCFACAALRRQMVDQVGLLDEKMFMYYEDVDYCIRARIAGWKLFYCPSSLVYHHGAGLTPGRRLGSLLRQSTPYRLRIMLKSYNRKNALKYGVSSVLKSMAAGLKRRDSQYFLGYARSPLWNILNLPVAERRFVQRSRKIPDSILENATQSDVILKAD